MINKKQFLCQRPVQPLFADLFFDKSQALWNIIILIATITSDTVCAIEQSCMAWQICSHQVKQNIFSAQSQGHKASCPGDSVIQLPFVFH